ncbi:hypothetical protein [Streptomyces longisporoflavus]|uniref:Uncharacterized protein n=1 Tax=Streptomyces longisporoflavus TaxID=28044 RepID=A0ABW7QZL5_9ACTN
MTSDSADAPTSGRPLVLDEGTSNQLETAGRDGPTSGQETGVRMRIPPPWRENGP